MYVFFLIKQKMVSLPSDSANLWIGLRSTGERFCTCKDSTSQECVKCRSQWKWIDDSAITFENWKAQEPGMGEECGRMASTGWAGIQCDKNYRFLCQKRKYFIFYFVSGM